MRELLGAATIVVLVVMPACGGRTIGDGQQQEDAPQGGAGGGGVPSAGGAGGVTSSGGAVSKPPPPGPELGCAVDGRWVGVGEVVPPEERCTECLCTEVGVECYATPCPPSPGPSVDCLQPNGLHSECEHCACDLCPGSVERCGDTPGCMELYLCALSVDCLGEECFDRSTCLEVAYGFGGRDSMASLAYLAIAECQRFEGCSRSCGLSYSQCEPADPAAIGCPDIKPVAWSCPREEMPPVPYDACLIMPGDGGDLACCP